MSVTSPLAAQSARRRGTETIERGRHMGDHFLFSMIFSHRTHTQCVMRGQVRAPSTGDSTFKIETVCGSCFKHQLAHRAHAVDFTAACGPCGVGRGTSSSVANRTLYRYPINAITSTSGNHGTGRRSRALTADPPCHMTILGRLPFCGRPCATQKTQTIRCHSKIRATRISYFDRVWPEREADASLNQATCAVCHARSRQVGQRSLGCRASAVR